MILFLEVNGREKKAKVKFEFSRLPRDPDWDLRRKKPPVSSNLTLKTVNKIVRQLNCMQREFILVAPQFQGENKANKRDEMLVDVVEVCEDGWMERYSGLCTGFNTFDSFIAQFKAKIHTEFSKSLRGKTHFFALCHFLTGNHHLDFYRSRFY